MSRKKAYKIPEECFSDKIQEAYNSTASARQFGAIDVVTVEVYLSVGRFSIITNNEPGPALDSFITWASAQYADLLAVVDKYKFIRYTRS